jgi:histidinol-phosphate aminotransferase
VMMGDDFVFPTNEVLAQVSNRTRLITIANPNNPTGATVASDELLRILKFASNSIVLVDEAYFEFGGETLLSEVDHYPNLIIARTFSKAYGLAGLRLGSLIGQPEQIAYLRRFCSPFNVNAVALACLEEALPDQRFVSGYVAQVEQGRERLAKLCAELGLRWWPSRANFLSFRIGQSCRSFVEAMAQRGIQVRDLSAMPGCGGCVRITVGTTAQMGVVLQAMRGVLTELRR